MEYREMKLFKASLDGRTAVCWLSLGFSSAASSASLTPQSPVAQQKGDLQRGLWRTRRTLFPITYIKVPESTLTLKLECKSRKKLRQTRGSKGNETTEELSATSAT